MSCITVCFTYSLRMAIFLNTDISQGSVATRLGCGGGIYASLCYKSPTESNSERILKIGKYLVKLWTRVRCLVFLTHGVYGQSGWLGSRVISVLDTGAEGPGFKSQSRRCRVTVLGKLFTPIVSLFTKQQNW